MAAIFNRISADNKKNSLPNRPAGRVHALFKVIGILLAQHFHVDDSLVDMFFHNGYAALGVVAQDGFPPYRPIPETPPACPAPQLIGKSFVDCPGREIDLRINGISAHEFYDERRADVISGGLRRGSNTISYTIRELDGREHPSMAIGLFVMPETPGNAPVCVFDHILDASDAAKGGSFTFNVSNTQIASMNPKFTGEKPQPFHAVPLKKRDEKTEKPDPAVAPAPPAN